MLRFTRRSTRLVGAAAFLVLITAGLLPAQAADDPLFSKQWNMTQIHAINAQSVSTGSGVKIGIVDSGVNRNHDDLAGRVAASATCVGTSGSASQCQSGSQYGDDIDGHGTHVAGIMSALTGNGEGVSGVAPGAQLVVARVFSRDAQWRADRDARRRQSRYRWVVSQGAKVVNLSIGAEEGGFDVCSVFCELSEPA